MLLEGNQCQLGQIFSTILENILLKTMFELPDMEDVMKVTVDKPSVKGDSDPKEGPKEDYHPWTRGACDGWQEHRGLLGKRQLVAGGPTFKASGRSCLNCAFRDRPCTG